MHQRRYILSVLLAFVLCASLAPAAFASDSSVVPQSAQAYFADRIA